MKRIKIKNGESAIIRPANKSDAKRIVDCVETISSESDFLTFGQGEFGINTEQEEKFLDNIAKQNNALFIVAEVGDKIVGTLCFTGGTRPRTAHAGEFSLSVLKEYWGNGIGTELTEYLIEWCKQTKIIRKIDLRVRTDNFSAIHIYKKLGFIESGIITREIQIEGKFYDTLFMGYNID